MAHINLENSNKLFEHFQLNNVVKYKNERSYIRNTAQPIE